MRLFVFAGGNYLLLLLKSLTPWSYLEEIFASRTSKGWVSHTKFCSGHFSVKVIVPSIGVPIIKINIEIPIIKIRWSWDHLIFIMRIPILIFMILLTSWCEFLCVTNITLLYWNNPLGAVSIRKMVLPGMAIPMLKIRRPNDRLIFNMEIAICR